MEKLVINGFEFPNNLQARLAIAHVCSNIIVRSKRGPDDLGLYRHDWKYFTNNTYNCGTINGLKKHFLSDYFDYARNPKSGDNKIWVNDPNSFNYLKPNEWTHVVANKVDEFSTARKETQTKNKEYRNERIRRIFRDHELVVGQLVNFNSQVFDLSWQVMADFNYPDSQYHKGIRKYDVSGKLYTDMNFWRTSSVNKWEVNKPGVLLGFDSVVTENGTAHRVAIVMYSDAPRFYDPRVLKPA